MADPTRVVYQGDQFIGAGGIAGRLQDYMWIIRPANVLMIGAGVVAGRLLAQGALTYPGPAAALASACLIGAGANVGNDFFDRTRDLKNHPERPLPAGRIAPRVAILTAVVLSLSGLAVAATLSLAHLAVGLAITLLLWFYNIRLKDVALVGNAVVAVCVAATVLFGAIGHAPGLFVWTGIMFAFALTLCREITKDVQDYEGDAAAGSRTFSVVAGPEAGRVLAAILTGLVAVVAPLPYLLLAFSSAYLALVLVADAWMLVAIWYLVRDGDVVGDASHASFALKAAMVCGLAGLALAKGITV